jgi:3-methyladenine DNA glycosylase AlkD
MTPQQLHSIISDFCQKNADAANVEKYSRYFKGGYNAWGLNQAQMNELTQQLLNTPGISMNLVLKAMPLLMRNGKYEETSFGLLLINGMKKQYTPALLNQIASFFENGITNWAHADTLAMWILPNIIAGGHATEEDFVAWLSSPYSFQRRCVPVTYIKSLKKVETPKHLFHMIEPLMVDPVREVHQGTGWFLREAWKLFPAQTEEFLSKHKNTAPRLIFQYACEKMDKEYRLKFRKEK